MIDTLDRACTRWGMRISGDKTKVLSIGEPLGDHPAITLKGQALEEVDSFSYLGSEVEQTSRAEKDVKTRIEKATTTECRCFGQWSCRCYYMEWRPGQ